MTLHDGLTIISASVIAVTVVYIAWLAVRIERWTHEHERADRQAVQNLQEAVYNAAQQKGPQDQD